MASIYEFKPKFQAVLRPFMRGLRALGFTPNGLTLLALAGSGAVGAWLWFCPAPVDRLWILPLWLLVRMALNALDGMMARELKMQSRLGAILNELSDPLSDALLFLPLARLAAPAGVVAFAILAVLTEFSGVLNRALGGARTYHGPMGKSDRAFWIGLLALATRLRPEWLAEWRWIFPGLAALCAYTCVNRLWPEPGANDGGAA